MILSWKVEFPGLNKTVLRSAGYTEVSCAMSWLGKHSLGLYIHKMPDLAILNTSAIIKMFPYFSL